MEKGRQLFIRSIQPLVGSVIGVGIFGLPFVFAQAGIGIALIHLVVLAVVNGTLLLVYADIIRNTKGNPRLTGLVRRYLGNGWSHLATVSLFGGSWGALVAYIIVGGEFLHALFAPLIGGGLFTYQMVFYAGCALLVIGGIGFISRLEVAFVMTLLAMLALIMIGSVPHVDVSNFAHVDTENWFLPFGVVLFAFGGIAAVPEMAHVLGRQKGRYLRPAIITGMVVVSIVYLLFSSIVTGVTGTNTTDEAILGLGAAVGDWALVLGAMIGLFSVFTSFLILAVSIMDTMIYDYKWRYLQGWALSVTVPLVIFLLGARSFIGVIGFTGGVLGSFIGLLVLYTYTKAKKDVCTPKRCLSIPNWILGICALVFSFGIVLTIASV